MGLSFVVYRLTTWLLCLIYNEAGQTRRVLRQSPAVGNPSGLFTTRIYACYYLVVSTVAGVILIVMIGVVPVTTVVVALVIIITLAATTAATASIIIVIATAAMILTWLQSNVDIDINRNPVTGPTRTIDNHGNHVNDWG